MLHTLFISVSPEHSPGFSVFHRPESGNPKTIRQIRLRRPEKKEIQSINYQENIRHSILTERAGTACGKTCGKLGGKTHGAALFHAGRTAAGQTGRGSCIAALLRSLFAENTTKKGQHTRAIPPKILLGRNASAGKLHPHHHAAITAQQLVHRLERSCI